MTSLSEERPVTETDLSELRSIVRVSERAIVEPRGEETLSCRQLLVLALPFLKRTLEQKEVTK
jgi:hypothetical protein